MGNTLRRWHWLLLHRIFGIEDRDHTPTDGSVSALLHSHPPVPAHHHRHHSLHGQSLQAQLARERARQPRILAGWQRRVGAVFDPSGNQRDADGQDSAS